MGEGESVAVGRAEEAVKGGEEGDGEGSKGLGTWEKVHMGMTVLIGLGGLVLWRAQIRMGKKLGEEGVRAALWKEKYEAMEGVREFLRRVLEGERFTGQDIWKLVVETKGREYLYGGTKVEGWLEGFYEKGQALARVDCILEGDKKEDFLTDEKREAMRKERRDLYEWFENAAGVLHKLLKEELGRGAVV